MKVSKKGTDSRRSHQLYRRSAIAQIEQSRDHRRTHSKMTLPSRLRFLEIALFPFQKLRDHFYHLKIMTCDYQTYNTMIYN